MRRRRRRLVRGQRAAFDRSRRPGAVAENRGWAGRGRHVVACHPTGGPATNGVDQVAEERPRAEARDRLRSRATRAERDDFLRRLAELTGGPPTPELVQRAEEFLSKPPESCVARRKAL